jgi:hypothetical protein
MKGTSTDSRLEIKEPVSSRCNKTGARANPSLMASEMWYLRKSAQTIFNLLSFPDSTMILFPTLYRLYHRQFAAVLAASALCASCAPSITSFTATPRIFCPDTTNVVSQWVADGRVSLTSAPALPRMGSVAAAGQLAIAGTDLAPSGETVVTLTASKFLNHSVRNQQHIVAATDPSAVITDMGPSTDEVTCDGQRRQVIAAFMFEPSEYDTRVVIRELRNDASRSVTVAHRGGTWTLMPNQVADLVEDNGQPNASAFAGGIWIITAPLLAGEQCGTPSVRPALSLPLHPTIGCTSGGAR